LYGKTVVSVRVSIVVLAAGASTRLGRPKQLLELDGEPMLRHTVRHALASAADGVVVVLGNVDGSISTAVGDLGQRVVVNPDFATGQSTSLVAGIHAVDERAEAVIVMLGDQPTVELALLNRLIERFDEARPAIIQPVYEGVPGNPVLFRRDLFPELLAVTGDQGAREIIRSRKHQIDRIDAGQVMPPDVDTDEDYERLLEIWNARKGM
jgi:molybdenum cofactor cytidylyltransferase